MTPRKDIYEIPRCPAGCTGTACSFGRHERMSVENWAQQALEFTDLVMFMRRDDPPLVFLPFAGIALMVNSERNLPAGSFENCSTCGAGTEGCPCEPNILAILAHEEGGSEWQ